MSTPEHIMKRIRQQLDLDKNDKSQDEYIESLSPVSKLRRVAAWELGEPEWADQILQWARDCGMKIEEE